MVLRWSENATIEQEPTETNLGDVLFGRGLPYKKPTKEYIAARKKWIADVDALMKEKESEAAVSISDEEWEQIIEAILGYSITGKTEEELRATTRMTKNGLVSDLELINFINEQRGSLQAQVDGALAKAANESVGGFVEEGKRQNIKLDTIGKFIGKLTKREVVDYDKEGKPIVAYDFPAEAAIPLVPSPDRSRLIRYIAEDKTIKDKVARQLGVSSLDYLTPKQTTFAATAARSLALPLVLRDVKTEAGRQRLQDFLREEQQDIQEKVAANQIAPEEATAEIQQLQQQAYGKGSAWEAAQWEQAGVSARQRGQPREATAQDWYASQLAAASERVPLADAIKQYTKTGETSGYPESFLGQIRVAEGQKGAEQRLNEQLAAARRFAANNPELYAQLRAQVARGWGTGGTGATTTRMISPETGGQAVATTGLGAEGAPTSTMRVAGGTYIPEFAYEQAAYGSALESPEIKAKLRESEIKLATERPTALGAYQEFLAEKPLYSSGLETWLKEEATPLQVSYIQRQDEELRRQRKLRERQAVSTTAVATPQARWLNW